MIRRVTCVESGATDPYQNLAFEEYLLGEAREDEAILYLWQNRNTVVIGKNQNAWKECNTERLEEDGGFLARRLSGGGAVYHDLGNLNFTFLTARENYSVDRQLDVILEAVRALGIPGKKAGRNDLTAEGRKFSGNAFYERNSRCFHHGTVMVDVDLGRLSEYLNVQMDKLKSKGVDSVRSRVCSLRDYVPSLSVDDLKRELRRAMEAVYGLAAEPLESGRAREEDLERLREKYASWEWKYGRRIPFTRELGTRFSWGDFTLGICVDGGTIGASKVYSDAMDPSLADAVGACLEGTRYQKAAMLKAVRKSLEGRGEAGDILGFLEAEL